MNFSSFCCMYMSWLSIFTYRLTPCLLWYLKIFAEENINLQKRTIIKNSDEEDSFIKDVIASFTKLDTSNILEIHQLEKVVTDFANIVESAWMKNSKIVNITKYSKSWWNDNCNKDLAKYRSLKNIEDWKAFQKTVKNTKRAFFDLKIQEIANKKYRP